MLIKHLISSKIEQEFFAASHNNLSNEMRKVIYRWNWMKHHLRSRLSLQCS